MTEQKQEEVTVNLSLTIEQVNFIMNALGKLPTESGAWMVRQLIYSQVSPQVENLQKEETPPETPVQ